MTRNNDFAKRIREVFADGTWVANTNYAHQLHGVTRHDALRSVNGLNSIAALTFHINYYLNGLLEAFATGELRIHDRYSFDMPPLTSDADWDARIAELLLHAKEFAQAVEAMDDDAFDQAFIKPEYGTLGRNIEAVIEHSYYHLGQIALIRKLLHTPAAS